MSVNTPAEWGVWAGTNDLGVKFGQPRLTIVVEDQYGVYHGGQASGSWVGEGS